MNFINNYNIGKRIYVVFGLILFLTFGNLIYNHINLEASKQSVVGINSSLFSIDYLIEADRDAYQSSIAISEALHKENFENKEKLKKLIIDINENKNQVKERYIKFSNIFNVKQSENLQASDAEFWDHYNKLVDVTDSIVFYLEIDSLSYAKHLYFNQYNDHFQPMRSILNDFTEIHLKESEASYNSNLDLNYKIKRNSIIVFVFILCIFIISGLLLIKSITVPLKQLREVIADLSLGKLPDVTLEGKDEIAQMGAYVSNLTDGLKKTSSFAQEIGNGNLNVAFTPLSEEDVLGHSLIQMKQNLAKFSEDDKQRRWVSDGVAQLGEILRNTNQSPEELYLNTLSYIIKYLKANQGSFFVMNSEGNEKYLELAACYAYDRKKYLEKKINMGEGLVGQAAIEKDIVYMTDVPANYVQITSGIGEARPRNILIVPLINNEEVYGVIELASFTILENHEIDFIKRISESIASTIYTVRINDQTRKLLHQSQQMTEELRSQEEEMRQNMEELSATQEETNRREQNLLNEIEELKRKLNA